MALPVTITGISTAVAPVGPFKATNGYYYFFGRDGTTATTLQAYKAVDPSGPAALIDTLSGTATGRKIGFATSADQVSQSITTVGASNLKGIIVALQKFSSPTDNIVADVYASTGSGLPTGSSLGQSTAIVASTISTVITDYALTWPTAVALSASTQYCIVLSRTGAVSATNNVAWSGQATSSYSGGIAGISNAGSWSADATVLEHRLQVFDTGTPWLSVATKTGFTTAILNLAAYQVGNVIHLLVQDGTASTSQAVEYVSFDASTDTFLATTETVMAAVAVTGQVASGWGASLVVRSNGNVVAFYNAVQTKTSGTFRARVSYRIRTGVNTYGTETTVDGGTAATDSVLPIAVLGASDRVHFIWASPTNVNNRTLSAANALNTATTSASLTIPGDGVSYDRSGTTKVVVTSNTTGQTVQRFDSSDNPTASYSTPTAANATLPHRIGTFPASDDVTIVYRNSADSDLYSIKSSDDGATFGTAASFFVGTVASADANVSRSSTGSVYTRGGNTVVGYIVNDGGTLKYNEYNLVSSIAYSDTITASALPIAGQSITGVYVGSVAYTDTIAASSVPIGGSTVAPVYTANYADTLTPSSVPIGGATLADVFASSDTIAAGAVPIVGVALADVFARSDTITPSSIPLVGAALADVLAFADTLTASSVPVGGQAIVPVYTANYTDTLTAGALPIGGQTVTAVYTARYADTITPSALPVTGATITAVYTANYADSIAAGSVPLVGSTIAPVYTARYSDTLTAGALPVAGQAITPNFSAGGIFYSDVIAAGAVPIGGSTIAPVYTARYADTITASSLPIGGQIIVAVYTARYSDTLTASSVPIGGQTIVPLFSAGEIDYTDTIAASAVPLVGQSITPVFSVGALPTGDTFVNVGGVWKPAITYVKDAGAWKAPVTYVKHSGIWTQL